MQKGGTLPGMRGFHPLRVRQRCCLSGGLQHQQRETHHLSSCLTPLCRITPRVPYLSGMSTVAETNLQQELPLPSEHSPTTTAAINPQPDPDLVPRVPGKAEVLCFA